MGEVTPVEIFVYEDRTYEFTMKVTPASVLPMKAQAKRFGKPLTEKVGKVNKDQIREIAEKKMPDPMLAMIEAA